VKFLQTIRFDMSDDHVFQLPAALEEWAVSGAFAFAGADPEDLTGKPKQAFANAFLGVSSFGHSTFATVCEISEGELADVETALARHFVERYGAPDVEAATPAAREEAAFILDLCKDTLINTVFTVRRFFDEDGQIKEEFRTIKAPEDKPMHSRIWSVVDDET
jgi:hypothetical protein